MKKLCLQAKQNKELIHCFPLGGRCPATSGKQGLCTCKFFLGKRTELWNSCLPSPFPELLLLSTTFYGLEYPFRQFGSAVMSLSLPDLLCPSLLALGQKVGRQKALMLWKDCWDKILVCFQVLATKHSIVWAAMKKLNSIAARPSIEHIFLLKCYILAV